MNFTVPSLNQPQRLDKFLVGHFPQSNRAFWKENLRAYVRVNRHSVAPSFLLQGGEEIEVSQEAFPSSQIQPNPDLALTILYEDDWIIAADKPALLPCYPLTAEETETVVNALLASFPDLDANFPDDFEKGLIHRLDNETSGVLLIAKNQQAKEAFQKLNQEGEIEKQYLAWVEGRVEKNGTMTTPVAHHPKNQRKMITVPNPDEVKKFRARPALTRYEVLETKKNTSLLQLAIRKGQRHQIRVHLAEMGHPIIGDKIYSAAEALKVERHLLHAWRVDFKHPFLKRSVSITSPIPEEFSFLPR